MIVEPLHSQDFVEEAPATGVPDLWLCKKEFPTALGPLKLELNAQPDSEMLEAANKLITVAYSKIPEISATLYAQYSDFAEHKHWMKAQGVPLNLDEDQISPYVERVAVYVGRSRDGQIEGGIFIRTTWDPEHGIRFAIRNERLIRR